MVRPCRRSWLAVLPAFVLAFLFGLFPLAGLAAAGQGTAPAGVIGQVKDESGAILPGVTVTATSPALQVTSVSDVTDAQGEYRLTPLPIGMYTVEYSLSGFQTVRLENIQLTVGFVAKLDQTLKVGNLSETVTVSGISPLVDVTSTANTTELTHDAVDLIPTSRDALTAFMGQVPAVRQKFDVGGSGMSDTPVFKVYGQPGQPWQMFEGVLTADVTATGSGSYYEFSAVEGIRLQTAGNNAEMPRRGMLIDATTKSGGNQYHGDLLWSQTSGRFASDNIDDTLRSQGVTGASSVVTRWDVSGNMGGKIVRDKLWFFGTVRGRRDYETVPGAPPGPDAYYKQSQQAGVGKGTYQINPSNKLIGFWHETIALEIRGASALRPVDAREYHRGTFRTRKIEWQSLFGKSATFSLQYGKWIRKYSPPDHGFTNKPAAMDISLLTITGEPIRAGQELDNWRHHIKGSTTIFRPDLLAGNHEFKVGFDSLYSGDSGLWHTRETGNYQLLFNRGVPFEINTWNYPTSSVSLDYWAGVYAQDAWTIGRRLTLNLGARFDHDNGYLPPQCSQLGQFSTAACYPAVQMKIYNTVTPRLHAAFDVFGDGKTAIKGGWGRFRRIRDVTPEVKSLNQATEYTTTWLWHDLNGNGDYNPGEVNLDPNGSDFVTFGSLTRAVLNPAEKQPHSDEVTLQFEHQLLRDLAIHVAGIYSNNADPYRFANVNLPYSAYNIPITNPDPGIDGVVGTADDPGKLITYYDFPAQFAGAKFATTMLINDPNSNFSYKTIEFGAMKRLSRGWQFSGSYAATKRHVPNGVGDTYLAYNPDTEINTTDNNWEWMGKVSAAVVFPFQIVGSFNYENRSGEPQARQVLFRGGRQVPSLVVNVEPVGSIRLPSTNLVDLRMEKQILLGGARKLAVQVDLFNLLNTSTVLLRVVRAGPTYLLPNSTGSSPIVPPRILQFGLHFSF